MNLVHTLITFKQVFFFLPACHFISFKQDIARRNKKEAVKISFFDKIRLQGDFSLILFRHINNGNVVLYMQ